MRPTVHFIAGLPRSGSTLLVNILGQNPRYRVAGTSGLVDMLLMVRDQWDQLSEHRAMNDTDSEAAKCRVLRGMFDAYFFTPLRADRLDLPPVHFDKSRTWPGHMEMLEVILGHRPKLICCIRDIREILASFELLWRANARTRQIPAERENYAAFQTLPGRLSLWTHIDGLVGKAYGRLLDAYTRGYGDCLHLVDYAHLTKYPRDVLAGIEEFLEEKEPFDYDFKNVSQITQEDDRAYNFAGLHRIRTEVKPQAAKWQEVLGEHGKPYGVWNDALFSMANRPREVTMDRHAVQGKDNSTLAAKPSIPTEALCVSQA